MSRILICLVCLTALAAAGPAAACINDVELPSHEREFRSQYHGQEVVPPTKLSAPTGRPSTGFLVGTAAVLLTGAVILAMSGRQTGR